MRYLLFTITLLLTNVTFAQTEVMGSIRIEKSQTLIKKVKVSDCSTIIKEGQKVKVEYTKKKGDSTYTITSENTIKAGDAIITEKEIPITLTGVTGDANLYYKIDDKSKMYVDFWLNPTATIKEGKFIEVITRKLKCVEGKKVVFEDYELVRGKRMELKDDKNYLLSQLTEDELKLYNKQEFDSLSAFFIHTDKILEVYENETDTIPTAVYYNKYDRNAVYELKLQNREYVSFNSNAFEYGPITIPFKYRFGYNENNVKVNQEFTVNPNLGIYAGFSFGKKRYRFESGTVKSLPVFSASAGGFLSLSAISLDNTNTTAGDNPFSEANKSSIGAISPGIGVMLNVYNINVGAYLGWDVGFGKDAKNWNYNNRPWLGLGLSYNVNGLFKTSE